MEIYVTYLIVVFFFVLVFFSLIFFFISFRQRKLAKWQCRRNSGVVVLSACCFGYKCQDIQLEWRLYSLVLRLRICSTKTTASFVFMFFFYDFGLYTDIFEIKLLVSWEKYVCVALSCNWSTDYFLNSNSNKFHCFS
jgi:hypothetical protein